MAKPVVVTGSTQTAQSGEGDVSSITITNFDASAGDGNDLIYVSFTTAQGSATPASGIDFNTNESFTIPDQGQADPGVNPDGTDGGQAYLASPTATTADIVMTLSSADECAMVAALLKTVDTASPITDNQINQHSGNVSTVTVDVTGTADSANELVIGAGVTTRQSTGDITEGAGQTSVGEADSGGAGSQQVTVSCSYEDSANGAVTHDYTVTTARRGLAFAAVIAGAAAGTTNRRRVII